MKELNRIVKAFNVTVQQLNLTMKEVMWRVK
jgi:hypothetical protein